MQAGSEEDFILNVGRRTFFPSGSAALDFGRQDDARQPDRLVEQISAMACKDSGILPTTPAANSAQVALSQKRADAVMSYLAAGGVAQSRMWAKGYGKDREVRDCPDKACKVQNRRVVTNLRNERDTP